MDNLTHILAGLLSAELASRYRARRAEPKAEWVRAAYFASALANNVPDFDFAYVGLSGPKLGYLLHHRGHTHTLLAGVPLGVIALGLVWAWARRRRLSFSRTDWGWLAALSFFGPVLHVFMDFSNSYGVHPFWPLDNRWVYGDRIFIVEPLFWAAALPALFLGVQARLGKTLLALWLALTVVLPFATRMVPLALSGLVLVWVVAGLVLLRKRSPTVRALVAGAGCVLVLATFGFAKPLAEEKARVALGAAFPGEALHDVVLTSNPANPACWLFASAHTASDGSYAVRRGRVSLAPSFYPAERCARSSGQTTAPLRAIARPSSAEVYFEREFVAPLAELQRLARESCEVAAYLRFARLPFWVELPGTGLVVGDVRFDREPGLGFAELVAERAPRDCPRFVPPWEPPRSDVLSLPVR
ncbi:MAG: metal-dependent hydrolase [Myxococcales bacterium]|nr:metal-dependent hydrolase [Myxococcales bacterium]